MAIHQYVIAPLTAANTKIILVSLNEYATFTQVVPADSCHTNQAVLRHKPQQIAQSKYQPSDET